MARIGNLTLDAPFFQAGLAGYSDAAMRLIARRHGAPFAVTEAMLDQFLINGGRGLAAAELNDADHPIAGQLMGSHPDEIAAGAKILVKLGYDVIDINLACPVKKIRKRSRGGHLLCVPDEAIAILDSVRQAIGDDRPCTVKLRRGSDDSAEAERNFHQIFEKVIEFGYAGAVVHGRTVEQKYKGPSRWEFLRGLMEQYGSETWRGTATPSPSQGEGRGEGRAHENPAAPMSIASNASLRLNGESTAGAGFDPHPSPLPGREREPERRSENGPERITATPFLIGGSGDIWCAADIFRMIRNTGVQLVSVARGCIGNPWIFHQARALMAGDEQNAGTPPTIAQQRDVLLEHFQLSVDLHGEKMAGMMMRKFGIKFSRHHPQTQAIAKAFIAVKNLADWRAVLDEFYAHDGPGVIADMAAGPMRRDAEGGDGDAEAGDEDEESCDVAASPVVL